MDVLYRVLSEIADREGVDPVDLEPPLYEVIDRGTVDALVDGGPSRPGSRRPFAEFSYNGYAVTVDGRGNVNVDPTDATAGTPQRGVTRSAQPSLHTFDDRERVLKRTTDIIAARDRPLETRLEGLLAVVRETLGVASAALSYVDAGTYVFEAVDVAPEVALRAGETVPLAETVCREVVETEQALVLGDVAADAPALADSATGVAAYLGVPIFVDGDVYGTFCFYDSHPRSEAFTGWDRTLVELLGSWVGSELERRKRDRALHARTFDRPTSGC